MGPPRAHWSAVIILAVIAVVGALWWASTVFAPVAFALFIIAILWPVQERLQAAMPKLVALLLCVILLAVVFVTFGWLIAWAFGRVARWVVAEGARFQAIYDQLVVWLEGHGLAVNTLWADHFNVGWLLRALQGVTGRVNSAMSFWLVVFVYVVLGLLEVDDFARRVKAIDNPEIRGLLSTGSAETARKFRRYMLVRTQMSVLTGVLVWAFARLVGLDLAAEWGMIAFTLNYVPFIGPLIATLFPTALALVQFESWQGALLVFAALNVIQFVVGSYIEPRVSGNALSISPTLVLFAVFFWTFMWGLLGAVIGVPIMIAVVTLCAAHPASRWLAALVAAPESAPAKAG